MITERPGTRALATGSLPTRHGRGARPLAVLGAGAVGVAAVGAADFATGDAAALDMLHVLVVAAVAWFAGRHVAVTIALAAAAATTGVNLAIGTSPAAAAATGAVGLVALLALAIGLSTLRGRSQERELAAARDPLTGALTRNAFTTIADHVRRRSVRADEPISLAHFDLDGFRDVNERHGRAVGDEILTAIGSTVSTSVRGSDVLGRAGSDEFLLLLPATDARQALVVIERLRALLRGGLGVVDRPITASIGLATFRHPPASVDDLLHGADDLMCEAKARGGDSVVGQLIVTTKTTWDGLETGSDIAYSEL